MFSFLMILSFKLSISSFQFLPNQFRNWKFSKCSKPRFKSGIVIKRFCWWLSRGHTHEFIVRISTRIRLRESLLSPCPSIPFLSMNFSFISFHHFAPWIKRASSCILKMSILFYLRFLPNRRFIIFMENGNEIRYLLMMMRWGLMKWFYSTSLFFVFRC